MVPIYDQTSSKTLMRDELGLKELRALSLNGCAWMWTREAQSCEESRGREKGATILVVLRLGLTIPGGQDKRREEESVKVHGQEGSVTSHQGS